MFVLFQLKKQTDHILQYWEIENILIIQNIQSEGRRKVGKRNVNWTNVKGRKKKLKIYI